MKSKLAPSKLSSGALIVLTTAIFFACGNPHHSGVERIIEQRDSLLQASAEKDTVIHQLSSSFDAIESNLSEINKKQSGLMVHAAQKGDLVPDKREEINQAISDINTMMESNAQQIRSLNTQLKRIKYHNVALSRMVDLLLEHIMYKNNDLVDLNHLLRQRNASITSLNNLSASLNEYGREREAIIARQQTELEAKDDELNTGYYLLGDSKELKRMCVLDQHGKLMGGFNPTYFKQVDIRDINFIPAGGLSPARILKLLTPHPSASYELVKNDRGEAVNVKIKDQKIFWSRSKYAVIETN